MEESQSKAAAPAPFLTKTYDMVEDPQTNLLVSWSDNGCSFIVWNPPEFCKELLPLYFKHNNFSSFVRQLNTYGFRKIDPDQWEFANEDFLRGKKHLLNNIYRRKPIHSHSSVQTLASSDSEKRAYEEEINRLQQENSFLHAELKNHDTGSEIQLLRRQLQEMETRQTQLVALLGELMEKHEFGAALIEESDRVRGKRRRLLELDQTLEDSEENSSSPLDVNSVEKLGSSLNFWNSFIQGVSERMNKEEANNIQRNTWSPTSSKENQSLPEFSPTTSSVYNNNNNNTTEEEEEEDIGPKCSIIDVNLEPSNNNAADVEEEVFKDQTEVAPEMNDVFWGQFLTEAPRPSDDSSQEVQSERRDTKTVTEHGKSWWNPHYVTWFG